MWKKIRPNVLVLVGSGYLAILAIFIAMVWGGDLDTPTAYDVVKGPLMALIGGSLAISKDLIDDSPQVPPAPPSPTTNGDSLQDPVNK